MGSGLERQVTNMSTESKEHLLTQQLFEQWRSQHSELEQFSMELHEWVHIQTKQREAQFREGVARLNELWNKLSNHFIQEQELGKQIALVQERSHPEADAMSRQSERDHTNIANRLRHLSDRMQEAEPEMDAWKSCTQELRLILDVFEQHEEQEAESVGWLLPSNSYNT